MEGVASRLRLLLGFAGLTLGLCAACCMPFPEPSDTPPDPVAPPSVPWLGGENPLEEGPDYEEMSAISESLRRPCPPGCTGTDCPGLWCLSPVGHPQQVQCASAADCFVAISIGTPGAIRVVHVPSNVRERPAFDAALDEAMRASERPTGPRTAPADAAERLSDVDGMCADLWCEGEIDFRFDALTCAPDGSCALVIRGIGVDYENDTEFETEFETAGRLELPAGSLSLLRSGEPPERVESLWGAALDGWVAAHTTDSWRLD